MRIPAALVALALVGLPARVPATSYVVMRDSDLADRAMRIVRGRVDGVRTADGPAALEYRVAVERTLHGAEVAEVTVRVPGNPRPAQGPALRIWGAPAFAAGQRVLLFLVPNGDGTERVLHLALGVFHVVEGDGGASAVRLLHGAYEAPAIGQRATAAERAGVRDLERFEAWLRDGASGRQDYFVNDGKALAAATRAQAAAEAQVWGLLRWAQFDGRRRARQVRWSSDSWGQPGLPGGGHHEFQAALGAWTRHRGSRIDYRYDGLTNATGGLDTFDGVNAILFQWPLADPFDCEAGGVLAIGGPWYDDSTVITFRGRQYHRIEGADIVVNQGIECFFARSADPKRAAHELFAHELGHTLGLGHSCGDAESGDCTTAGEDEALMRAFIHDDGRGAALTKHDRAAICGLYPSAKLTTRQCATRR